jgi:hypothetical protein
MKISQSDRFDLATSENRPILKYEKILIQNQPSKPEI